MKQVHGAKTRKETEKIKTEEYVHYILLQAFGNRKKLVNKKVNKNKYRRYNIQKQRANKIQTRVKDLP